MGNTFKFCRCKISFRRVVCTLVKINHTMGESTYWLLYTAIGSVMERHILHDPCEFVCLRRETKIYLIVLSIKSILFRDPHDKKPVPCRDFYYDMSYCVQYTSFANLPHGTTTSSLHRLQHEIVAQSPTSSEDSSTLSFDDKEDTNKDLSSCRKLVKVLDLYAGCGAMSTGLCHGARPAGMDIDTLTSVKSSKYKG